MPLSGNTVKTGAVAWFGDTGGFGSIEPGEEGFVQGSLHFPSGATQGFRSPEENQRRGFEKEKARSAKDKHAVEVRAIWAGAHRRPAADAPHP